MDKLASLTIVQSISSVAGVFAGGFWVWKRMRAEYESEKILSLLARVIVGAIVFGGVSYFVIYRNLGVCVWGTVAGAGVAVYWWCVNSEWDTWEWLDGLTAGGLVVGTVVALAGLKWQQAVGYGVGVGVVAVLAGVHRRWRWYVSGKPGLVGLIGLMWLGLVQLLVANRNNDGLYWGGFELSQWIGLWVVVACTVVIYLRGGRRVTQDAYNLWQKTKIIKKRSHRE